MTTKAGGVEIPITTDEKDFIRGLMNAERKTATSAKKMQGSMVAAWGKVAGVAAAALSIRAFDTAISDAHDYGNALHDVSEKLGIGVERLQEYRFAASTVGVTQTALDVGIQRFVRRMAEADQGVGVLADVFDKLNIKTRDAEGNMRGVHSVLGDFAEALKNAGSQSERVALAFKAFDTEGVAMVSMLKMGREGFEALIKEARASGVVLSDEVVAGLNAVRLETIKHDAVIKANTARIAANLSQWEEWKSQLALISSGVMAQMVNRISALNKSIDEMSVSNLKEYINTLKEMNKTSREAAESWENIPLVGALMVDRITKDVKSRLDEIEAAQDRLSSLANTASGGGMAAGIKSGASESMSAMSELKDFMSDFNTDVTGIGGDEWKQSFFINDGDVELAKERAGTLKNIRLELVRDSFQASMKAWGDEDKLAQNAIKAQKAGLEDLAVNGINKMTDALKDGELSWKEMGSIALEMLPQITKQLMSMNGIGGSGSGGGGGMFGQVLGMAGSLFGFANGGNHGDAPRIVGEHGPEIDFGGKIIPNHQARQMIGGQTVVNNHYSTTVNAQNADGQTITHLRGVVQSLQVQMAGTQSRSRRFG
jgi:hypothetical protein